MTYSLHGVKSISCMSKRCVEKLSLAVFGLTANPATEAHVRVAQAALSIAKTVLVAPTYDHASKPNLPSFEHRLKMTQLAVAEFAGRDERGKIIVSDVEARLGKAHGASYTIFTLEHLKRTTGTTPGLIIGSDNVSTFDTWKRYQDILNNYPVYVVQRPYNPLSQGELHPGMTFIDVPEIDGCSGDARKAA